MCSQARGGAPNAPRAHAWTLFRNPGRCTNEHGSRALSHLHEHSAHCAKWQPSFRHGHAQPPSLEWREARHISFLRGGRVQASRLHPTSITSPCIDRHGLGSSSVPGTPYMHPARIPAFCPANQPHHGGLDYAAPSSHRHCAHAHSSQSQLAACVCRVRCWTTLHDPFGAEQIGHDPVDSMHCCRHRLWKW